MKRYGLIGFGAIGASVAELWGAHVGDRAALSAILARPHQLDAARALMHEGVVVTDDPVVFLEACGDAVIEAAGHAAVSELGATILESGRNLLILSVGALSDPDLNSSLQAAAAKGSSRIIILPGALAGFDGLLSLRAGALQSVRYISSKPPSAWAGTPGEALIPAGINAPFTLFSGSAKAVCSLYPKNANLAAAVAFAGLGLERTMVELVADPCLTGNRGHLIAHSDFETLEVILIGDGFKENPKSSRVTALSVVAAIENCENWIGFR